MKKWIQQKIEHRFGLLLVVVLMIVCISFITRFLLLLYSFDQIGFSFILILGSFVFGLAYDLVMASYYLIPISILLILIPNSWISSKAFQRSIHLILIVNFLILFFNATAEILFWDEFSTRFNFIAVDYLVYTTEVVGNVQQSYPMGWIISIILFVTVAISLLLKNITSKTSTLPLPFRKRLAWGLAFLMIPVLSFLLVSNQLRQFSSNAYANELAGSGLYELFAAYRNNELDYDQFYKKIDIRQAFGIVHEQLKTREATFTSNDQMNLERVIVHTEPEKKMNLVLISIESFSASFMKVFGNKDNITPHLDSLAEQGMLFTNLFATGTRTVRGLEALSLCIPPTPGQAIVRRPNNENLFSMGSIFREKGYESKFIYGGYGYFDNMEYFFSNNSYEVDDRMKIPDEKITYENIWGVADENLFELTIEELDRSYKKQKPVFAHVMTTTNHRPFTYPDGRINIPSHTGRNGAVKYTDYAIHKFLQEAATKPWFKNTLFVITADHCASSAGKTELPVDKYHIPMIIYSPEFIQPQRVDRLMSQIDIGPTLLGVLDINYTSHFLGIDIFESTAEHDRVFISTYQLLGFMKNHNLTILEPKQAVKSYDLRDDFTIDKEHSNQNNSDEAIAWYQVAGYAFKNNMMKR
jgi:Phosphoglycerol transferase and related proteins, alkaline phosphatase superfamily